MTLQAQSFPGVKYFSADFQNQQILKITGYDEESLCFSYTSPVLLTFVNIVQAKWFDTQ